MTFSDKIKRAREVAKLTQNELAQEVGVSQRTIASYESGGAKARRSTTEKLARALKVSVKYLSDDNCTDPLEDIEKDEEFKVLDDRFIHSPAFAIEQCKKLTDNMATITRDSMLKALDITNGYSEEIEKYIYDTETRIDNYEDKLGTYLVKISANELSAEDGKNISTLLHCIGDFERISDHATNLIKASKEMKEKNIAFSGNAKKELEVMTTAVADVLNLTVQAFIDNDLEAAHKVEPIEEVIDTLKTKLKSRHVKRLRDGECTIELGFIFADFITNLERVSDHCSNIAVCLIQMADANFEVHDYIHELKASGEEFDKMVEEYQQIYMLPEKSF